MVVALVYARASFIGTNPQTTLLSFDIIPSYFT
jgi:hypothetical protein